MPLSTLHPAPRGTQRKTRGQDGLLLLSCGALSSPTARRFIPTIALANARGSDRSHDRKGVNRITRSQYSKSRSAPGDDSSDANSLPPPIAESLDRANRYGIARRVSRPADG